MKVLTPCPPKYCLKNSFIKELDVRLLVLWKLPFRSAAIRPCYSSASSSKSIAECTQRAVAGRLGDFPYELRRIRKLASTAEAGRYAHQTAIAYGDRMTEKKEYSGLLLQFMRLFRLYMQFVLLAKEETLC